MKVFILMQENTPIRAVQIPTALTQPWQVTEFGRTLRDTRVIELKTAYRTLYPSARSGETEENIPTVGVHEIELTES